MNLRKKKDGTYSRHYKKEETNQTLCGLSLKRGHAWAESEVKFVTCAACQKIKSKWENSTK